MFLFHGLHSLKKSTTISLAPGHEEKLGGGMEKLCAFNHAGLILLRFSSLALGSPQELNGPSFRDQVLTKKELQSLRN